MAKSMRLDTLMENLDVLTRFVDSELEAAGCPDRVQYQIDIVLDEIFSNIVTYAYPNERGTAVVQVEFAEAPSAVRITFQDSGVPFNPLETAEPDITKSAEERSIGGLGIYIVKKTMDEVIYSRENGKNILTIEKRL